MRTKLSFNLMCNQKIIVDGPDGTGKTSLCKQISEKLNIPFYHLIGHEDEKEHEKQFEIYHEKLNDGNPLILDRYILSDIAYSNVYNNGKHIPKAFQYFEELFNPNITLIITLPLDKEKYLNHFRKLETSRKEMFSSEKMGKVYEEYENFCKMLKNKKNFYRYDIFSNALNIKKIVFDI